MRKLLALALTGAVVVGAGCKKNTVDKDAFKSALNKYVGAKQECLWTSPVKLPVQADASDDDQTKGFDALTDAELLTRKAVEKKRFLIGSKQANDYDLSDQGRAAWTADPSQPGYGNFCYGHPEVTSVDGYSPDVDNATQYAVNYHYQVASLPPWASSAEMKAAFPKLNSASAPQAGSATLVRSNDGWLVQNAPPGAAAGGTQ
ncbi:MAG TPA: hypothetical protein VGL22_12940 [Terracidiphilus sp.]